MMTGINIFALFHTDGEGYSVDFQIEHYLLCVLSPNANKVIQIRLLYIPRW